MRGSQSKGKRTRLVALVALALASSAWAAPKYKILHVFGRGEDGVGPWGSLALDAQGNAYGTTRAGGAHNYGTVFELMPRSNGHWEARYSMISARTEQLASSRKTASSSTRTGIYTA